MSPRRTVLHVVESYGAGTASAVTQYVCATPDLSHHLIRRLRPDDDHADGGELRHFRSVAELPAGVAPAIRAVRAHVQQLQPDIIHAHSSWAGVFARLAGRLRGSLLVYTPHCFAMERQDVPQLARHAYWFAERLLSVNTDVYAACSLRELTLAKQLAPRRRHVFVANVAGTVPPLDETTARRSPRSRPVVVTMGRITAQRDPAFFVQTVDALRARTSVDALWVGGGDSDGVALLEAAGVEVTGWLPRVEALSLAASCDVYLHTALWDGAPMSLVEANALGLPAMARACAATEGLPQRWLGKAPHALAVQIAEVLSQPAARARNRRDWSRHFASHTVDRQRSGLLDAYGVTA